MSKRRVEDYDLLSAIWILASNDENHLITFEGIRDRLGLPAKFNIRELILSHRELFRPGAPTDELEQWKADMREGRRRPAWIRQIEREKERKRTIDAISVNDVFRSQFRSARGAAVSPLPIVDWGLQHLDRLRRSRLALSEVTAKSWQMWLVFGVGVASVVVSIAVPLLRERRTVDTAAVVNLPPSPTTAVGTSQPRLPAGTTNNSESAVAQQVSVAQLFLVAISIFAVALAEARNEKLKTGLSLAGIIISIAWGLCVWCADPKPAGSTTETVLAVLPALAAGGWLISTTIHAGNWIRGTDESRATVSVGGIAG